MGATHRWSNIAVVLAYLGLAFTGLLCGGCGGRPVLAPVVEPIDPSIRPPISAADVYHTEAQANPVVARAGAEGYVDEVQRRVGEVAQVLEIPLVGDGRLAQLADWLVDPQVMGVHGDASVERLVPRRETIRFFCQHLGLVERMVDVVTVVQTEPRNRGAKGVGSVPAGVADAVAERLSRQVFTHFGVAMVKRGGLVVTVVALSQRWVRLEPVKRVLEMGGVLVLRGDVHDSRELVAVTVTAPDGSAHRITEMEELGFDLQVQLQLEGMYQVEMTALGLDGIAVVAEFPVYVGTSAPQALLLEPTTSGGSRSTEQVDAALRQRLVEARGNLGMTLLIRDRGLDSVALSHSREMATGGKVAHEAEGGLGPAARVSQAGYGSGMVLENVGVGADAGEVHRGWMSRPSDRANLANPDVTHYGLGVVEAPGPGSVPGSGEPRYWATELFVRMVRPIDVEGAPARLLGMLNNMREARGADWLEADEHLAGVARVSVARFFGDPEMTQQDVVDDANRELKKFAVAYARVSALMVLVSSLDEAVRLEPALDPTAKFVGVGVMQGSRPDTDSNVIGVVWVLGWDR